MLNNKLGDRIIVCDSSRRLVKMPSPGSECSSVANTSPSLLHVLKKFRFKKSTEKIKFENSVSPLHTSVNSNNDQLDSSQQGLSDATTILVDEQSSTSTTLEDTIKVDKTPEIDLASPSTPVITSIKRNTMNIEISSSDSEEDFPSNIQKRKRNNCDQNTVSPSSTECVAVISLLQRKRRRILISSSEDENPLPSSVLQKKEHLKFDKIQHLINTSDDENTLSSLSGKCVENSDDSCKIISGSNSIQIDKKTTNFQDDGQTKPQSKKGISFESDDSDETELSQAELSQNHTHANVQDVNCLKKLANDEPVINDQNCSATTSKLKKNCRRGISYDGSGDSSDSRQDSSDESNYYSDDDDYDSDDSTNKKRVTPFQTSILSFFNDGTTEELLCVPGISKLKAASIVDLRPFTNWKDLNSKLEKTKSLSTTMISGAKAVLKMRNTITHLLKRCEVISVEMEGLVNELMEGKAEASHIKEQPQSLNPNLQLASYQLLGLNWLALMHRKKVNGILADEMGLGKTIQAISLFAHLLDEGNKGPHLVIVPSSTLDNWVRELRTWCSKFEVLVYYGSHEERSYKRHQLKKSPKRYNVIVTTYTIVMNNEDDRAAIKSILFQYVVYDEAHMLKNMKTIRYKNLMKIRSEHRLLLTGTPLQNNLTELLSLLLVVMPNIFGEKIEDVKHIFSTVMKNSSDDSRSRFDQDRIDQAKRLIKPFVLRRLKTNVLQDLPEKMDHIEHIDLTESQQNLYDQLIITLNHEMAEVKQNALRVNGSQMMMQLRKLTCHPLLMRYKYGDHLLKQMSKKILKEPTHRDANPDFVFEDMEVMSDFELHRLCCQYKSLESFKLNKTAVLNSGKFVYLDSLLESHKIEGNRILLFSQFTMMLDIMEEYLTIREHSFVRLDGSTPVSERQELIDKFNSDSTVFIFLLSTKAGGLGINLTAANVVILHDIDFNPYNDKQAEDRCHRVGQTKPVTIIRLICKNTIEEGMLNCARNKLRLEADVIAPRTDNEESTSNDVISLLKLALGVE